MDDTQLETERLFLRKPDMRDVEAIAELANNLNVARNLARMPHPYAQSDAEGWVGRIADMQGLHGYTFGLYQKASADDFMGVIGIQNFGAGEPAFGFWIGEPYWNCGYMSEAALALRDFAFADLNAPVIRSAYLADNPASGRVVEKIGLRAYKESTIWAPARKRFEKTIELKLERVDWQQLAGV